MCFPTTSGYGSRKWKIREKWQNKATIAWNARLPSDRSNNARILAKDEVDVFPQSDSPLFRKLPLDIRLLIYMELLSGNEFIIQVDENTVRGGDEIGREKLPFKLTCPGAQNLLAFIMSCKLLYIEAKDYIYTSNTFRLRGITPYWCLTRVIPSQSLDLIQDLHLQWSYPQSLDYYNFRFQAVPPYSLQLWNQTWEGICKMKGLKQVRVDICFAWPYDYGELFLTPLTKFRESIKVEVHAYWEKDGWAPESDTWPFLFIREGRVCRGTREGHFILDPD